MDVDIIDAAVEDALASQPIEALNPRPEEKRPVIVELDDSHPFDVEAYISAYSGLDPRSHSRNHD